MAITYPLALPNDDIASVRLMGMNAVAYSQSPFTFGGQVHAYPGQAWRAEIELPIMDRDMAEPWVSFLLSLRGQFGTFLLGDPACATPRGAIGGTPLVNGADQTGGVLNIDGATALVTGWLKAGDYIQLGTGASSTLHKVLADANSDGSGQVILDLWPHVRTAPADNSTVTVTGAKGRFRLGSNQSEWSINSARFYGVTFEAMEAI